MPKVRYVGPFDQIVLPTLGIETVPGGEVDVDDESFANLVEQHDWEPVDATSTRRPPKPEPVADAAPVESGDSQ